MSTPFPVTSIATIEYRIVAEDRNWKLQSRRHVMVNGEKGGPRDYWTCWWDVWVDGDLTSGMVVHRDRAALEAKIPAAMARDRQAWNPAAQVIVS